MKIYFGLDDSGRGPVIGPMLLAGVALNEEQKYYLKSIGVKDSKLLSSQKRKQYEEEIKKNCLAFKLIKVTPQEIDKKLNYKINLNKIEAIKFASIVNELYFELKNKFNKINPIIIVDCPSTNIKKWKEFFEEYINDEIKKNSMIIVKHKAEKHVFVAAASILAKEEREREIEKIKKEINFDFGSGYPSDPKTIEFLKSKKYKEIEKNNYFVRQSWNTIKKLKEEKQKKLKDFFVIFL
ncbi:MAG: ribonuclease HII [Candidatus Pacearchaeota archaeon]